jgi:hypothetical protein
MWDFDKIDTISRRHKTSQRLNGNSSTSLFIIVAAAAAGWSYRYVGRFHARNLESIICNY